MSVITATPPRLGALVQRTRGLRELALLAGLYAAYSLTRLLAANDLVDAQSRADDVVALERALHADVELWLNRATSDTAWIAVPMDYWYCALHYLVTPAVLGWLYLRRPLGYARARTALAVTSALGLVGYLIFPTAPPRLMGGAYVDTLAEYAHLGWWAEHASAPAGLGGLTNELAAMPSLHVGWAVWCAWAICANTSWRWRRLAYGYPLGTALVVVCTGNHWVLDGLMGLVVTVAGIWAASHLSTSESRNR